VRAEAETARLFGCVRVFDPQFDLKKSAANLSAPATSGASLLIARITNAASGESQKSR